MPAVSIIIPVFNAGAYLVPCLDSVRAQTSPDWECILVDDGSTDGSGAICDEVAASDRRFTVLHKPNGGVGAARADGAGRAAGDYLCFFDSDDLADSRFVEVMLGAAVSHHAPIVCCRKVCFTGTPPGPGPVGASRLWRGEQAVHHLLHDKAVDYGLWNRLFRRDSIIPQDLDNGYRYNEDLLANWYALRRAGEMAFLDYEGYLYRQQPASASHLPVSEAFLLQQWQVAGRIARSGSADTIQSFYYEKLLYLYSMILRQDNWRDFDGTRRALHLLIKKRYNEALRYRNLSVKMKLVASMSVLSPGLYRPVCRAMLRDRRRTE